MIMKEKIPRCFIKFSPLILKGNVWGSVWRICMWILGLKGLKANGEEAQAKSPGLYLCLCKCMYNIFIINCSEHYSIQFCNNSENTFPTSLVATINLYS